MLKNTLAVFILGTFASLCSGLTPGDLPKKAWYQGLTETQKGWINEAVKTGVRTRLPVKVFFLPLEKNLTLYDSPATRRTIASVSIPSPARNAQSLTPEVLVLRNIRGTFWDVSYRGKEGWIERSSVRPDSFIVLKGTGPYVRDLFLNFSVAGERAPVELRAAHDRFLFRVTYSQDYSRADERRFEFEYDPNTHEITGVSEAPATDQRTTPKTLASLLDGIQLELVKDETGIGRDTAWSLKPRGLASAGALKGGTGAVRAGEFLLVDGSLFPGMSSLIAP